MDYKNFGKIPERMHGGLIRWVENGIVPGGFLCGLLTNDLREAVLRADNENVDLLADYVRYLYNNTPSGCWGSVEKFNTWQLHRGLAGLGAYYAAKADAAAQRKV